MTAMPKVKDYPVCSECRAPYVLRRTYLLAFKKGDKSGNHWLWQRDCKHKKAVPLVNSAVERAARQQAQP